MTTLHPSPPNVTPALIALAAQIGALTQTVDDLERAYGSSGENATTNIALALAISDLHSTIDALNALYESNLNEISESRRAKWLLRDIIRDLPAKRDWLDPYTERAARTLLGMPPMEVSTS